MLFSGEIPIKCCLNELSVRCLNCISVEREWMCVCVFNAALLCFVFQRQEGLWCWWLRSVWS